jgi:signal transduction histidine kinase
LAIQQLSVFFKELKTLSMQQRILLFLLLLGISAAGQNTREVDSLLQLVDTEIADSAKLRAYRRIGNFYMETNPGKAISYFEKVKPLAQKTNNILALANSYYDIGYCNRLKGDFDQSLENYQQSMRLYETLKDNRRLSNALMSVAAVYFQNKDFKKTSEYHNEAEQLITKMKDSLQLNLLFSEKANLFDQQKKFDEAILYHQKALLIAKQLKDDYYTASAFVNIGLTYKHKNETAWSFAYFDSAQAIFKSLEAGPDVWAVLHNNVAATHAQAGNYKTAKENFDKSIGYAVQAGYTAIEMENYRNMADMYGNMSNYQQQSIYLQKYYTLKDSLFSIENKNQLTQLEADYQVEKKNAEIVKKDAEVIRQKSQRNIFLIAALAALLLFGVLAYLYRRIRTNNRLLQEKNLQINEQKNQLQSLNHVKDRLFSIISHDVRNPLVTLRSYLTLSNNPSLSEEKKEQFKNQTFQAVTQTTNMLDNLLVWANMQIKNTTPSVTAVSYGDIVLDAVADVKAQALQKRINITTNIELTNGIGNEQILSIALRNLLTNAIKYNNDAGTIDVHVYKKEDNVLIAVKDSGTGMSKEQIQQLQTNEIETTSGTAGEKGSGLGIFLVKELLQRINGTLLIESEPGAGSCFTVKLPA